MDPYGASLLTARLRAAVRTGQTVEFTGTADDARHLQRGDLGRVDGFTEDGRVVVSWSTGIVEEIDPADQSFLPVPTRFTAG